MRDQVIQIENASARSCSQLFREIARLHCDEIPDGFLASLGVPFLSRMYACLAGSPDIVLLVAHCGPEVAGFLCGTTDTRRVYRRFFWRHAWQVALQLVRYLFSRRTLRRLFETGFYPARAAPLPQLPPAEILNFCVSSPYQGQGVGQRLFEALTEEFARRGVPRIRIVTGANQRSAQKFYQRQGAHQVCETEVHRGVRSLVYVFDIPGPAEPASSTAATAA